MTVAGNRSFCMGKVAGDGQEGVYVQTFSDKGLEAYHYSGGASLMGQTLQGAVAAGMIGAGTGYGLSHIPATRINETHRQDYDGRIDSNITSSTSSSASATGNSQKGQIKQKLVNKKAY